MRTYGRIVVGQDPQSGLDIKKWVEVTTDPAGFNDEVWLTTLAQVLLLNLNESPFFANWGIPAKQSVLQQLPPDFYASVVQQQFAGMFASIIIARDQSQFEPTYSVQVITHQGVTLNRSVKVPI